MRSKLLALCLGVAAGCGACTVGPDFHPPSPSAPAVWGSEPGGVPSQTVAREIDETWWDSFHDPELASLIQRLAVQNLDLQEAAERVYQGRAQTQVAASRGLPGITYNASYKHERESPNGTVSLVVPAPGAPLDFDYYRQGPSASWELDLFGRVRRAVEAQRADTLAAVEARHAIALSAAAELATDYLQLRGVQARMRIAENNLQLAEQNTKLVTDRLDNGVATTLDLAQARAQRATIAQTLPTLRAQAAALINAIGLLLAEPPRALESELSGAAAQPGVPPEVPVGIPGTLVRRRPDVREAEARLHAATAQVGVATAEFYPDVTLNGHFDLEGLYFGNAFDLPDRAYSVGPDISLPIFEGGRLRGALKLRKSQQREALIAFQRTLLQAWHDVDNALTAYSESQRARNDIAEAVQQNQIALGAARQRYVEGAADFLNVVSAEASLLQSQNALSESDAQIATELVRLYRALGGGWQAISGDAAMIAGAP